MNAKTIGGVIVAVILLAVGWYVYDMQRQAAKWKNAKEIVEEHPLQCVLRDHVGGAAGAVDRVPGQPRGRLHGGRDGTRLRTAAAGA